MWERGERQGLFTGKKVNCPKTIDVNCSLDFLSLLRLINQSSERIFFVIIVRLPNLNQSCLESNWHIVTIRTTVTNNSWTKLISLSLTADKNGRHPCLTDKNCPAYSKCVNNRCSCRHELAGNGETCKPRKLRFYALSPAKKNKIKRYTCHAGYSKCQYYWSTYRFYRRISVPKNGLFATFLLKNSVCKTMVIRVDQFYKVIEDFFFIT